MNERTNFWRKAALNDLKEQKPQCERNPEWLAEYEKNKLGTHQKTMKGLHQYYDSKQVICLTLD